MISSPLMPMVVNDKMFTYKLVFVDCGWLSIDIIQTEDLIIGITLSNIRVRWTGICE